MKTKKRMVQWSLPLFLGLLGLIVAVAHTRANVVWPDSAVGVPTGAADDFLTVYTIPTANSGPFNITVQSVGRVWFTMRDAHAIGSLVVNPNGSHEFDAFETPTANSEPYDLDYDGQFIWFTERLGNRIGRLNPANGSIQEFVVPTANAQPTGIAVAPNGHIWFTERAANKIARFEPGTQKFTEFPLPAAGGGPEDVAINSSDSIWFTAPELQLVMNYRPSRNQFESIPVLDFGVPPWRPGNIAVGSSELPWITAPTMDLVGRYAPGTLAYWRWFDLRVEASAPSGIFMRQHGGSDEVWFVQPAADRAGFLLTTNTGSTQSALWEQPLPGGDPDPQGITVDNDDNVWITASGINAIIGWQPPYVYVNHLPSVTAP